MGWLANVVYSTPVPSVIDAFAQRGLGDALYVVRDLRDSLRFEWARREFFEKPTSEIRHGLPERGLLAVMPPVERSNYDTEWFEQRAADAQLEDFGGKPADKWEKAGFVGRARIADTNTNLEWPTGLHDALVEIASTTGEPLFHSYCETSGGPPDFEAAFVASPGWPIAVIAKRDDHDPRDVLVDALVFLGLELPSGFFAPHSRSFDWSRYFYKR